MVVVIVLPGRRSDARRLADDLRAIDVSIEPRIWPEAGDPEEVEAVVAWKHPPGLLREFPRLRLVLSFGAGVEHLLADPGLPPGIPLVRTVEPGLLSGMAEYVVSAVAQHRRHWEAYREDQRAARWNPRNYELSHTVLLLGMGRLGRSVARALKAAGLSVEGWNRTGGSADGVPCRSGRDALLDAASRADAVVCLLPLTGETENILDRDLFGVMKEGSLLVNVGRGAHLVENDLIEALGRNRPAHAVLDVFRKEPLPGDHPFWSHPSITVTPHVAALTDPGGAAERIAENLRRLRSGEELLDRVDRERGY